MRLLRPLLLASAGFLALAPMQPASAATIPDDCPPIGVVYEVGSFLITNPAGSVACVTTRHYPNGAARFERAVYADGWTMRVKSSGGTTNGSKVEVEFRSATGQRCGYMIRLGEVRGSGDCGAG